MNNAKRTHSGGQSVYETGQFEQAHTDKALFDERCRRRNAGFIDGAACPGTGSRTGHGCRRGRTGHWRWTAILQRQPNDIKALVGRATAYGWQQDWRRAEVDINHALQLAPSDLSVLNAAGYIAAWSGKHGLAEQYFQRMLAVAPDNAGAKKGLAYNAYWAGENETAANAFQQIAYEFPEEVEPWIGVGNARIAGGQVRRSAQAFRQAKAIDPANTEARSGLQRAYDYPAIAELSVWGGDTSGGGDAGLRMVELASWVTPQTRVWARYDDGLSLDNPVLARTGQNATTYFIGGCINSETASSAALSSDIGTCRLAKARKSTSSKGFISPILAQPSWVGNSARIAKDSPISLSTPGIISELAIACLSSPVSISRGLVRHGTMNGAWSVTVNTTRAISPLVWVPAAVRSPASILPQMAASSQFTATPPPALAGGTACISTLRAKKRRWLILPVF